MIKAAIFDLDGVLLDSLKMWKTLGSAYVKSLGFTPIDGMDKKLFSMSMEQGAEFLTENFPLKRTAEQTAQDLTNMMERFYFDEVKTKPGAGELLEFLSENGVKAAAATSSPRGHVTRALERNGLLKFFEGIFTVAEVGKSKHSPKIYRQASELLGAAHEDTVVVEDSLYALITAKIDGYQTAGIYDPDGESSQKKLEKQADVYCKNLDELRKFLDVRC